MYIGETARHIRKEIAELSQREVAEFLGISPEHLSCIENDKQAPSKSVLAGYKELCGVDLYVLAWCRHGNLSRLPRSIQNEAAALESALMEEVQRKLGRLISR